MVDNRRVLRDLLNEERVRLQPGEFLDSTPAPFATRLDFSRVEGMLLGLAVGDALGNTTEGYSPKERRSRFGEIRDYLPNPRTGGTCVGLPSDDTQLAFWTLEQLLADGGLVPEHLARRFCRGKIIGIGATVSQFVRRYRDQQMPWYEAGLPSAGNGALMRIAPILIPHLKAPSAALWADSVLASMITHNDPGSTASCVAFVNVLWQALGLAGPPSEGWWLETFCKVASDLEGETAYSPRSTQTPIPHEGPIWAYAERVVSQALREEKSVLEACESWQSGAYLLETVPSVLYVLETCGGNAVEAVVRAVNDTRDNDTIAAIVGAAVGALHGKDAFSEQWLGRLVGYTTYEDEGRVFELIEEARNMFERESMDTNMRR
jgi:ADP-ribosylglycohydrolase